MNKYHNKLIAEPFSLEDEADLANVREGVGWKDGYPHLEAGRTGPVGTHQKIAR